MNKNNLMLVVATILTITISGCAEVEIRHEPVFLRKPVKPLYPAINSTDLMCLSDDAYKRLVERQRLRRNYSEVLEGIIDGNNEGVTGGR